MRVVLDTNVIVSVLLRPGRSERLLYLWQERHIVPLVHPQSLAELQTVMQRSRFGLTADQVNVVLNQKWLPYLHHIALSDEPLLHPCKDPSDDLFLRMAIGGRAEVLVSGDKALRDLNGKYRFPILGPGEFLNRYFPEYAVGESVEGFEIKKGKSKKRKAAVRS